MIYLIQVLGTSTVGSSGVTVVPVTQATTVRTAAAAAASASGGAAAVSTVPQNALQLSSIQVVQPVLQHIPGIGQVFY